MRKRKHEVIGKEIGKFACGEFGMDQERASIIKGLVKNYFNDRFKKGDQIKILDIGCWNDYIYFKDLPIKYYGLDLVKAVDMPRFVRQDLNKNPKLPFKDNFFDGIFCFEVLEHLCFPEKIINEIKRVIKPNGLILISLPNDYAIDARFKFLLGKDVLTQLNIKGEISDYRHRTIFKASTARRWIEKFFKIDEIFCYGRFSGGRFLPSKFRNWLAKMFPDIFCRIQIFKIVADFK